MANPVYQTAVIVNGTEHALYGDPFFFVGEEGLGASPLRRFSEQGAQQHGDTDRGFVLDPRLFAIVLQIAPNNGTDFFTYRSYLLSWFAPYNNPTLKFTLAENPVADEIIERCLDCHLVGDLSMSANDRQFLAQRVGLQLKANDPSFYDPAIIDVTFALGGGGGTMEVPTEVPTQIGASSIDLTQGVVYAGTWYSFPQFRIEGPCTDCVITNETTGEKLDFTGTTISDGDYYLIDTRYGRKSVVDSNGANKIGKLTSDSDLATFHLEPPGTVSPDGANSIRVVANTIDADTIVYMTYYKRYLGI